VSCFPARIPALHQPTAFAGRYGAGLDRTLMRYIVIGMFILIIASLGSALVFIYRDESGSKRAVKALAIRVGLSIALFLFLMAGYYFGFIPGRLTG
jgi:hypothetical protein